MRNMDVLLKLGEGGMKEIEDFLLNDKSNKLNPDQKYSLMCDYVFMKAVKDNPEITAEGQKKVYSEIEKGYRHNKMFEAIATQCTSEQVCSELKNEYFIFTAFKDIDPPSNYLKRDQDVRRVANHYEKDHKVLAIEDFTKSYHSGNISEFEKKWNKTKENMAKEAEEQRIQYEKARKEKEAKEERRKQRQREKELDEQYRNRFKEDILNESPVINEPDPEQVRRENERREKVRLENERLEREIAELLKIREEEKKISPEEKKQQEKERELKNHISLMETEDNELDSAEKELGRMKTSAQNADRAKEIVAEQQEFEAGIRNNQKQRRAHYDQLNKMEEQFCDNKTFESMSYEQRDKFIKDYLVLLGTATQRAEEYGIKEFAKEKVTERVQHQMNKSIIDKINSSAEKGSDCLALLNTTYVKKTLFGGVTMDRFKVDKDAMESVERNKAFMQFNDLCSIAEKGWELEANNLVAENRLSRDKLDHKLIESETVKLEANKKRCTEEINKLDSNTKKYTRAQEQLAYMKTQVAERRLEREKELLGMGITEGELNVAEREYTKKKAASFNNDLKSEHYLQRTQEISNKRDEIRNEEFLNDVGTININAEFNTVGNLDISEVKPNKQFEDIPLETRPAAPEEEKKEEKKVIIPEAKAEKPKAEEKKVSEIDALRKELEEPVDEIKRSKSLKASEHDEFEKFIQNNKKAPKVEEPKVEAPKAEEKKVSEIDALRKELEEPADEIKRSNSLKASEHDEFEKFIQNNKKAPKVEEPKVEAPKVEAPKAEEKKVEEKKAEAPKVAAPPVQEPKKVQPVRRNSVENAFVASNTGEMWSMTRNVASKVHIARRDVWFGSNKYEKVTSTMDKLNTALKTLDSFEKNPNISAEKRQEALKRVEDLNKELKERTLKYFNRKKEQNLLDEDMNISAKAKDKTAKRINAVKDAMTLTRSLDMFASMKRSQFAKDKYSSLTTGIKEYPTSDFARMGDSNDKSYYEIVANTANQSRRSLLKDISDGNTITLKDKKKHIARIMVNEVFSNHEYRNGKENLEMLGVVMKNELPEASMDPHPGYYNRQIDMMMRDPVFTEKVKNLSTEQVIGFLKDPSKLTKSYVTDPKKATSLDNAIASEKALKEKSAPAKKGKKAPVKKSKPVVKNDNKKIETKNKGMKP